MGGEKGRLELHARDTETTPVHYLPVELYVTCPFPRRIVKSCNQTQRTPSNNLTKVEFPIAGTLERVGLWVIIASIKRAETLVYLSLDQWCLAVAT